MPDNPSAEVAAELLKQVSASQSVPSSGIPKLDYIVRLVHSFGLPLVMCGFMAWAFYVMGDKLFTEHMEGVREARETIRATRTLMEASIKKHEDSLTRIESYMRDHGEALKALAKMK